MRALSSTTNNIIIWCLIIIDWANTASSSSKVCLHSNATILIHRIFIATFFDFNKLFNDFWSFKTVVFLGLWICWSWPGLFLCTACYLLLVRRALECIRSVLESRTAPREWLRHRKVRFTKDLWVLWLEGIPQVVTLLLVELKLFYLLLKRAILFLNRVTDYLSNHLLVRL